MLTAQEARKLCEENTGELINKILEEIMVNAKTGMSSVAISRKFFNKKVEEQLIELGYTLVNVFPSSTILISWLEE